VCALYGKNWKSQAEPKVLSLLHWTILCSFGYIVKTTSRYCACSRGTCVRDSFLTVHNVADKVIQSSSLKALTESDSSTIQYIKSAMIKCEWEWRDWPWKGKLENLRQAFYASASIASRSQTHGQTQWSTVQTDWTGPYMSLAYRRTKAQNYLQHAAKFCCTGRPVTSSEAVHDSCPPLLDAVILYSPLSGSCALLIVSEYLSPSLFIEILSPSESWTPSLNLSVNRQEVKGIWQRLHRMTPRTQHAAYTACAAADLSRVTDRQTRRTSVRMIMHSMQPKKYTLKA